MNDDEARPIPGTWRGGYWEWKTWRAPSGQRAGLYCADALVPHWRGTLTAPTAETLRPLIEATEIQAGQAILLRNAGLQWRDIALRLGLDSPWRAKALIAWFRGGDPGPYINPGPRPETQPA